MKKCPFCAEEIQDEAIKCQFCNEYLKKKKLWKSCLIGCLVIFFISVLAVFLFFYLSFLFLKFILYKMFFGVPPAPPFYFPPFLMPGWEDVLKNFGEFLKWLWDKLTGVSFSHIIAEH